MSSSQERWFVVLRFQSGPLSFQGDMPLRGPVIRVGANPGPGGLRLEGYRGLDDRQAVITAYDGGSASVAPVGPNQVRMAPHEHVDWNEVQPIRGPVFLSNGCAIHFGPPGRGATAVFVECRRLGAWEQGAILSDASQLEPEVQPTLVKELDAARRIPIWVIPGAFAILTMFVAGLAGLVFIYFQIKVDPLGPIDEGQEIYDYDAANAEEVKPVLYEGVEQAYAAFVMEPNIKAAGWGELENREKWDKNLMQWITRSEQLYGKGWAFWRQLDKRREEYATVVSELRKAGLPDVLAGIPYQESRYNADASDVMYCAKGFWQFQPETAKRAGVEVRDCKFRDDPNALWSPTLLAPPTNVGKNADYVRDDRCRITSCAVDQRTDLRVATLGAIKILGEAFNDPELRYSGAVTQIVIATHNAGYDDARYRKGQNIRNLLPAYRLFVKAVNVDRAPDFFGRNILCVTPGQAKNFSDTCGGYVPGITQKYVPYVIAQHFLAVCYYGTNYADELAAFDEYRKYVRGNGYCKDIRVPTKEQVAAQAPEKKQ